MAVAPVNVVQEAADQLVGRDFLRAELRRVELTLGGAMVAVAGIAVAIAELV